MTANRQDFSLFSGNDRTLTVTVTDDSGTVVDITGMAINWSLSKSVDSAALVTKSTGAGSITVTDGPNGIFEIDLNDTDLEGLAGRYYHEGETVDGSANNTTIIYGSVIIRQNLV